HPSKHAYKGRASNPPSIGNLGSRDITLRKCQRQRLPRKDRFATPPLPTAGFRVVLLNRELQVLRCPKRNFPACFDLDRFSGCRIAAHASCALPDLQDPKACHPDSFALLEMVGDKADEIAEEVVACL